MDLIQFPLFPAARRHFQSSSCYFHLAKNKGKQNNNNYREKRFPENPLRLRAGLGSGDGTTALPQGRTRPRAQESLGGTGRGPEGTGDPIFSEPFCFTWRHRGSFQSPWGRVRVPWEVLQKPWCVSVWGGLVSPSLLNCSAPVHPSPSPAIGSVLALICGDELRQKTSALGLEKVIPA